MPASTTLTPHGQRTRIPGVRGRVDASALAGVDAGLLSLVILGEGAGAVPVSVKQDGKGTLHHVTSEAGVRALLRSGDLRAAGLLAFNASRDDNVPSTPASVVLGQVNPSNPALGTLSNGDGPAIALKSLGYGAHSNRISVGLAVGTTKGFRPSVSFDGTVESTDDLGGDPAISIGYQGRATTAALTKSASKVQIAHTMNVSSVGPNQAWVSGDRADLLSNNAADVGIPVTVYGISAADAPVSETLTLNGTTPVIGTVQIARITGVKVLGGTVGAITVRSSSNTDLDIYTVAPTLTAPFDGGEFVAVSSTLPSDVGQDVAITGVDAAGRQISETVTLNGTTQAITTKKFQAVRTVRLSAILQGSLQVRSEDSDTLVLTLSPGALDGGIGRLGLDDLSRESFAGPITFTEEASLGGELVIRGTNLAGSPASERLAVGMLATVSSVTSWSKIDHIEHGAGGGAIYASEWVGIDSLQSAVGDLAALGALLTSQPNYTAIISVDEAPSFKISGLDDVTGLNVRSATPAPLYADLDTLIGWFNRSTFVSAERADGAGAPPDTLAAPFFLGGGADGTTTIDDWRAAFDACASLRDVIIVPMSTDPAVHELLRAHCQKMAVNVFGQDERQGVIALGDDLDADGIRDAIRAINSAYISAVADEVKVYDETGERVWRGSPFTAVIEAAMVCGSALGEPMTNKAPAILDHRLPSGLQAQEDAERLLEYGLIFLKEDEDRGPVWMRSITTYRDDANLVFNEQSSIESANASIKRARRVLRDAVGRAGGRGITAGSLTSLLIADLQRQVSDSVIAGFDPSAAVVRNQGDAFALQYAAQPLIPVNFVNVTGHMVLLDTSL